MLDNPYHHGLIDELARRVCRLLNLQVSLMALGDGLINDRTRHTDAAPTNVLGIEQIGFNEISEGWAGMGRDIANGLSGLPEYAEAQKFLPSVTIGNFAAIQQMFPQEGSGQAQPNKSAADEMLAMASNGVDGAFKNTNRPNRFTA